MTMVAMLLCVAAYRRRFILPCQLNCRFKSRAYPLGIYSDQPYFFRELQGVIKTGLPLFDNLIKDKEGLRVGLVTLLLQYVIINVHLLLIVIIYSYLSCS